MIIPCINPLFYMFFYKRFGIIHIYLCLLVYLSLLYEGLEKYFVEVADVLKVSGGIITWKREKGIAHRYGQNLLLGRYNFALQLSDLICVCVFVQILIPLKQHYIVLC